MSADDGSVYAGKSCSLDAEGWCVVEVLGTRVCASGREKGVGEGSMVIWSVV